MNKEEKKKIILIAGLLNLDPVYFLELLEILKEGESRLKIFKKEKEKESFVEQFIEVLKSSSLGSSLRALEFGMKKFGKNFQLSKYIEEFRIKQDPKLDIKKLIDLLKFVELIE